MKRRLVGLVMAVCGAALSAFAGYTRMDFITSQGDSDAKCSWVNTGYTPACTDRIEVKARFLRYNKTQNIFCSRDSKSNNSMTMFFINSSGYKIRYDRGASGKNVFSTKVFTSSADSTKDYVIVYDGNAKKGLVEDLSDGTSSSVALDATATTYTPGSPLALFASHTAGTGLSASSGMGNYSNFRFYYCRVYDKDGKLLHNFVPARDDSLANGALAQYGVYDTIGNTFHANLGKKAFAATGAVEKGLLGAAVKPARTIGVAGHVDASGRCATALTFSNAGFAQHLYCAWSANAPGGDMTNSWEHVEQLTDVTADETTRTVTAPAGAKYVRYFLQPAVPGATAVAFLHSSGKDEYIDTGFTPNSASRVDCSFTYDSTANFQYGTPFGSRTDTTLQFLVIASKGGNNWMLRYGTQDVTCAAGKPGWSGAHTVSLDHNLYTLDGTTTVMTRADFTCPGSAYVFANNNKGKAEYFTQISLNSLTYWDDGALVRNYVPCVRTNGTPALYDTVNGGFAENKGTTAFTTGAEVWSQTDTLSVDLTLAVTAAWTGAGDGTSVTDAANWCCTNIVGAALAATTLPTCETALYISGNVALTCPTAFARKSVAFGPTTLTADCDWRGLGILNLTSRVDVAGHTLCVADLSGKNGEITDGTGWTELDYLWPRGAQNLVTDIVPTCTDRVETEVMFTGTGNYCLWCARTDGPIDTFTAFFLNGVARFDRNYNTTTFATNTPAPGVWTAIVADYKTCEVTLNGAPACTMTGGTYNPAGCLCLFSSHTGNPSNNLNNRMSGYMRYFRLFAADGTRKLDLVPRMRNADSVCGFLDRVSGKFYTSTSDVRGGSVVATDGTGTLRVEIPEGTTCTNTGVLLSGGLAVVKEGAGTLVQSKTMNCFARGSRIAEGRVETPAANSAYSEQNRLFGGYETPFVIDAGASFNGRGNTDFYRHPITLAGTLVNAGGDMASTAGGTGIAQLTGDATLCVSNSLTLRPTGGLTDLQGHTLTIDIFSGKNVYPTSGEPGGYTNGTIVLRTGGWFVPATPCDMPTVDLIQQACALNLASTLRVRDYSASYAADWNAGSADLVVVGTFTPVTDYFYGATLQDGAFLDLSARTNAWSTTSAFTAGRTTVTFAEGATIAVKLGTRTPAVGEKIIAWTAVPEATFVWDDPATHTAAAVVGADGLYYGADPASAVVNRAVWTGAAKDGDLRNPANWSCTNLAGASVPNAVPGATSAIVLGANTTFNFTSAEWLPFIDSPSDTANKAATVCSTIPASLTGVNKSPDVYAFLKYEPDDFVYLGATPLANLRDATWTKSHFAGKLVRFDGWFNVTAAQAGTWTLRAESDDYVGVLFDGVAVASNGVYNVVATSTCEMTAGWHRFTAILGDISGGYGPQLTINGQKSFLGVSINGAAEVAFEDAFTFGSGAVFNWFNIDARGCTLGADCNWCALATTPAGVVDLNGHTLRVNGFMSGTGSVTNSSATCGTLAVGVAARGTVVNSTLALTGRARLLKDGAGTYRLSKAEQLFTGGIDVAAGVLQPGVAGSSHPFGAAGGEIRVAADGTLDLLGKGDWQDYTLRLAGGSVYSSAAGSATVGGFARVTLDADSGMPAAGTATFVLAGAATTPARFDLNGHTFSSVVKVNNSLFLNNTVVTNGTWNCAGQGGWLKLGALPCDFSTITFNHKGSALYSVAALDVDTYIGAYYQSASEFPGFNVTGTFKPVTVYFDRVTLQDGATLDLTGQTAAWSTTSANVANGTRTCSFAWGARITVNCKGRTLAAGDKLIAWTSATAPESIEFTLDADSAAALGGDAVLVQTTDGLYVGNAVTWKGGDGALDDCANWQTADGGTPTTLEGQTLDVTGTAALTSAQKVRWVNSKLRVKGTVSFTEPGGLCFGGLEIGATGRIVLDPLAYTLRFMKAPTFAPGAKIALAPRFASKTKGRFLLMTWDTGTPDAAALADLFDTSSTAAGAAATLSVTYAPGGVIGYLWLDLAPSVAKPTVNVLVIGDRVAKGESFWGNFRIPFVKELEADGYAVQTKGFWQALNCDLSDATMPDAWTWHSSDAMYAFRSRRSYPGFLQAIENVLEQAGDVDLVVSAVGVNDMCSDGVSGAQVAVYWTNLVSRILEQKPHAKVLACNMPDRADVAEQVAACNAQIADWMAAGVFPAKRVYLVDLFATAPRTTAAGAATGNWMDAYVPSRAGMAKIGAAVATVARQALADDPSWQTGVAEPVVVSSGAEANVPAAERAGFTRARSFDIAANSGGAAIEGGVPYEEDAGVVENIGRVAWYVELKRPNGSTRWLWAAVDSWGANDIQQVGVPVRSAYQAQRLVSRLRVKTNMPGLADTPDGAYERGAIEFTSTTYGVDPSLNSVMPAANWGFDWNDTYGTGVFGSMQLHRLTPGGLCAAEVLFAFNGWKQARDWDVGLGNFANYTLNSTDWTRAGVAACGMVETMSAAAYEVARLEIWTMPAQAPETTVATALWTGAAGTSDLADPANWSCTNAAGAFVANGVPDARATVRLEGTGLALTLPEGSYAGVTLGDCTLAGDLDLRGQGDVRVAGTVDLAGHKLFLDRLVGGGTITEGTVFDLSGTDATKVSSPSTFYGGVAANLFNGNTSFSGTDNTKRVILEKKNLPFVVDYDFGEPTTLDAYRMWVGPLAADTIGRGPSAWTLAGSNDGTTWTTVDSREQVYWSISHAQGRILSLDAPVTYRKYRLTVTDCPDAGYLQICQLEYGRQSVFGELHVDVPEGLVAKNTDVAITWQVRVFKDGLGTFQPARASQSNWSLTVNAGTLTAVSNGSGAHLGRIGEEIKVEKDAKFELNGQYDFDYNTIILNGGTLCNTPTRASAWSYAQVKMLRLGADSTVSFNTGSFIASGYRPASIELRGHTLTATASGCSYFSNMHVTDGTLRLIGPWEVFHTSYNFSAPATRVELEGRLACNAAVTLADYYDRTTLKATAYSNTMTVTRRFQPTTEYFYGCTLADGATLDLTAQTGTWNTSSKITNTTRTNVTFAANAAITVDVRGRRFGGANKKLIGWHDALKPVDYDTLSFTIDADSRRLGYRIVKKDDGVYIHHDTTIIFIR